jgi:hypothetical protein
MDDGPATIPFKVFGLQRTGTNLAIASLQANFYVESVESGAEWKHGPVEHPHRTHGGELCRFVLCVRDPYSWLTSCYRYFSSAWDTDPTVCPTFFENPAMTFSQFLRRPSYSFETPIARWNVMNAKWLDDLPQQRMVLVRLEDQFVDKVSVLRFIEVKLGLTRKLTNLVAINARVDIDVVIDGPMDVSYYRRREYLSIYSADLLGLVNGLLDPTVMRSLGYDYFREGDL